MTSITFLQYFTTIFYPFLCDQNVEFPIIVFIDGHSSHFSFDLSNFCEEKKIVMIALYPNSTHIIQPMDVAVFGPLKKQWRAAVHDWKFKQNSFNTLTKEQFVFLLQDVIQKTVKPEHLKSGFESCGLYPFTPDGIDFEKTRIGMKTDNDTENGNRDREIERHEFEIAFRRIGEMLSSEKENAYFKFYTSDKNRAWDGPSEDKISYEIWRTAFQRSRKYDEEEEENTNDVENANEELIEEVIEEWIDEDIDPNLFVVNNNEFHFVEMNESIHRNQKIQVLDDEILKPAFVGSMAPIIIDVPQLHEEIPVHRFPAVGSITDARLSNVIQSTQNDDVLPTIGDQQQRTIEDEIVRTVISVKEPESSAQLSKMPVPEPCHVEDVFLKHTKPSTSGIQTNLEKFRLPRIIGKINMHFTSLHDTHFLGSIDLTTGKKVVSSEWHQDYVDHHRKMHEQAVIEKNKKQKKKRRVRYTCPTDDTSLDSSFEWSAQERKKRKSRKAMPKESTPISSEESDPIFKPKKIKKIVFSSEE